MKYIHGTIRLLAGIMTTAIFCMACEKENRTIIPLPDLEPPASQDDKVIALVEQSQNQVALVNATTGETLWQWTPADSGLSAEEQAWFNLPDEVKPIYNCEYLLITATRGGVAIIRIADKRVMFYACPKGQPHSAELLPDGNVVVASSTDGTADGDMLRLYEVDFEKRFAAAPVATYPLPFGHNAVWDRTNELLWATADNVLNTYTYVQSEGKPALVLQDSYPLPEGQNGAHELFPVYGLNQLWLTTLGGGLQIQRGDEGVPAFQCQHDRQHQVHLVGPRRLCDHHALPDRKLLVGQVDRHRRPQRLPEGRIPDLQGTLAAQEYLQLSGRPPGPSNLTRHEIHRKKNWNASPGSHAARRMPVGTAAGV